MNLSSQKRVGLSSLTTRLITTTHKMNNHKKVNKQLSNKLGKQTKAAKPVRQRSLRPMKRLEMRQKREVRV